MSANNNDEKSLVIMALSFAAAGAMVLFVFFAALVAFATFVMTILAICAWNKPLHIGKIVITPEEARSFVYRGVAGAFLVPAFLFFAAVLFGVRFDAEFLPHMMLLGYVGGSVGLEMLFAHEEERRAATMNGTAAPPVNQPASSKALPGPSQPFRFASWDDEEEQGR